MNRRILQLAIPSIISNITVPLLGLVDVAITGHMGDARYMAAISVASMVFNILYWLFSFLRFGTGGMTAQAFGQGNPQECGALFVRSGLTCLSIATLLVLLQHPLLSIILWIISPEASLLPFIQQYYDICIWGTFPSLMLYALTGWFVGMQNTRVPMVVSVLQNVINIMLSYTFVYYMNMKLEGVALGTLLAQWCGATMGIAMLMWHYGHVIRSVNLGEALHVADLKRFFLVNQTLFLRTLFLVAVNLFFIVAGARGGTVMLAVNSLLMQMFILYSYVMDGFAFAAEALCGRYYGARDGQKFGRALHLIWLWAMALTVIYTLCYTLGGDAMVALLTDERTVRTAAEEFLPWAIAIPVCGVAAFVWDGVFVGITHTRGMLAGTFGGALAFFILYYACFPFMGNHALWLAFNAYLLMRGVVQHCIYHTIAQAQ